MSKVIIQKYSLIYKEMRKPIYFYQIINNFKKLAFKLKNKWQFRTKMDDFFHQKLLISLWKNFFHIKKIIYNVKATILHKKL